MKRISFFSYKGGAGRTTLVYNQIPLLANKMQATAQNPIILVDMDIDSAGLTFLIKDASEELFRDYYETQDLLSGRIKGSTETPDDIEIGKHPLFSIMIPAGHVFGLNDNKSVLFVAAKPGGNIEGNVVNFDKAGNPVDRFQRLCKTYGCKAVILDTPTGDQLTARWSLSISDIIVCCTRISFQFIRGTFDFLKRKETEFEGKTYILVPNAVPNDRVMIDGKEYDYGIKKREIIDSGTVKDTAGNANADDSWNNKIELGMLDETHFGIPEVKRFKLQESILWKFKELEEDEKQALECYNHLCNLICD